MAISDAKKTEIAKARIIATGTAAWEERVQGRMRRRNRRKHDQRAAERKAAYEEKKRAQAEFEAKSAKGSPKPH